MNNSLVAVSHELSTLVVSKRDSDDHGTQINEQTPGCPSGLLQYTNIPKPKTGDGVRKQIFAHAAGQTKLQDLVKYSDGGTNNILAAEESRKNSPKPQDRWKDRKVMKALQ